MSTQIIGISVIDLNNKEFLDILFKELAAKKIDDEDGHRLCFCYGNGYFDLSNAYLFHLEYDREEDYFSNQYIKWNDFLQRGYTSDVLYKDQKNFLLFNIDWTDDFCQYEMGDVGLDTLFEEDAVLHIKHFKHKNEKIFWEEPVLKQHTLCYSYHCWHDEHTQESDSNLSFVGIVDVGRMHEICFKED